MPRSRLQRGELDVVGLLRNGSTFLLLADFGHSTSLLGTPGLAAPSHMMLGRAPVGSATSRSRLSRSGLLSMHWHHEEALVPEPKPTVR
ncbi:hypothetical protein ASPBRDRAFT_57502 [Aspergillus brasiliensis CBS 101740]|uniref:Uncharacterized protein n=1 Tax=Aspergillus brasiliensis (strain CBS 101740 / IMI 381727 / IBT 21946) TaxID=767769 RepID=A0A1L9UB66_ASPBC|nr:hypothetical protein ASPBRDRAFT_57502 [Aspergillus brasiliensis CBS 101740]